jgi:hypothetical protein
MKALSFEPSQRHYSIRDFTEELAHALLNDDGAADTRDSSARWLRPTIPSNERAVITGAANSTAHDPPRQTDANRQTTFEQPAAAQTSVTRPAPRVFFTEHLLLKVSNSQPILPGPSAIWPDDLNALQQVCELEQVRCSRQCRHGTAPSEYAMIYWLTVQKMRNGNLRRTIPIFRSGNLREWLWLSPQWGQSGPVIFTFS